MEINYQFIISYGNKHIFNIEQSQIGAHFHIINLLHYDFVLEQY